MGNFGVSGATLLESGTPNVWSGLSSIEAFAPKIAIIVLGTNDTIGPPRDNWKNIAAFEQDYEKVLSELAALPTTPRIFVCTPTAMALSDPELPKERKAELAERRPRLQDLCKRIEALAHRPRESAVSWIDLQRRFEDQRHLFVPGDGVHPNEKGYAYLARTVAPFVRAAAKKTNIVLFLVDDLGWGDVSLHHHRGVPVYSKAFWTPNVNRLAARGMRFQNAYASAPVCTSTRTSLLTGRSPGQTRITYWTLHKDRDTSRPHDQLAAPAWRVNGLNGENVTLPQLLRGAGYRTIHVGKAHLAAHGGAWQRRR